MNKSTPRWHSVLQNVAAGITLVMFVAWIVSSVPGCETIERQTSNHEASTATVDSTDRSPGW